MRDELGEASDPERRNVTWDSENQWPRKSLINGIFMSLQEFIQFLEIKLIKKKLFSEHNYSVEIEKLISIHDRHN